MIADAIRHGIYSGKANNTDMQIEESDLESELEELCNELGITNVTDIDGWESPPVPGSEEAALVARAGVGSPSRRTARPTTRIQPYLGGVSDGKPAPGLSPHFEDHVVAFERIQNADSDDA